MFDEDKCGFQHKLEVYFEDQSGLGASYKLERKLRKERRRASSVFEDLVDAMSRRSDILYRAFSALHERERTATHE